MLRPSLIVMVLAAALVPAAGAEEDVPGARVRRASRFGVSQPVRDLPRASPDDIGPAVVSRLRRPVPSEAPGPDGGSSALPRMGAAGTLDRRAPALQSSFDGISNTDNPFPLLPPDPNIDVGLTHIVEMTNVVFAVYEKDGTLAAGPTPTNALWAGFGGLCETTNQGDPIVLYDSLADRWLMSQFAYEEGAGGRPVPPFHECIAVSQSDDPTGAWFLYDFLVHQSKFNDYPKLGVWSDAYYMTANQFGPNIFLGVGVWAFERDRMLAGDPGARMVYRDLCTTFASPHCGNFGMLPADVDGATPPPAGDPGLILGLADPNFEVTRPGIRIFEFHVDWSAPASSTLADPRFLRTDPFDTDMCGFDPDCIPQQGTPHGLDAITSVLMHALRYRNFGTHEALVVNHTVDVTGSDRAGVRWYELARTTRSWFIAQEGTVAGPGHRWAGSIAMDASGNLGLGYSVSSASMHPAIRYTGRLAGDPEGAMQTEATLHAGNGSQTSDHFRWGDYSAMAVDPSDDCTFWYVNEHYPTTSDRGWKTRIGSYGFPSCDAGSPPPAPSQCDVEGTAQDDLLVGTGVGEEICGFGGEDTIRGHGGPDLIRGGPGDDLIRAGSGRDTIFGGGGDDRILGHKGADVAFGGPGRDRVAGGPGPDTVRGGGGDDRLLGNPGRDSLFGGGGFDVARGGGGRDLCRAEVSHACET